MLTVEAETDVLALRVGRSEFLRMLKDEPSVSLKLLQELARRTRAAQGPRAPLTDRLRMTDAVVVGSGPNGLAAAIPIALAGRSVRVLEGAATIGGGTRTEELTLPGYLHDVCSGIHPLAVASPFLRSLPLCRARPAAAPLRSPAGASPGRWAGGSAAPLAGT